MQESDRYAQYETMGKHLPEEAPITETLHPREEIVTLRAQHHAKIRHRVIGGLILVVTGAAIGPMIFDEAPTMRTSDVKTMIPSVAKEPLNKIYIPVEAPLADRAQPGQAPAGGLGLSKLDQQQDLTKVKPGDVSPQAAPQDVNVDKSAQVEENGAFFIQVLATSSEAGAMKAMSRFQALGFPVHSVRVQKKSATLWRVRLGHFKTRAQAQEAIEYLDRRKIAHLTIQEEKGIQKPTVANAVEKPSAPEPVKPVAKAVEKVPVKPVAKPVAQAKVVKTVSAAKPTPTKSVEKKPAKVQAKPTVKPAAKPQPKPAAKGVPKEKSVPVKKTVKSDDPLAATLKAAQAEQKKSSSDFIAEQIAKERKK